MYAEPDLKATGSQDKPSSQTTSKMYDPLPVLAV